MTLPSFRLLSLLCCLACCVLTTVEAFLPAPGLSVPATACLLGYMLLDRTHVQQSQWVLLAVLSSAGVAMGARVGEGGIVLYEGLRGVLVFLLLFGSVTLLQFPALHSPGMGALRQVIGSLPPSHQYGWLAITSHFVAGITNFAGFTLLSGFATETQDRRQRLRIMLAISRGFVAASTWSPFFMSLAVVVSVIPDLQWHDIALPGFLLGQLIVGFGSLMDYVTNRGRSPAGSGPKPANAAWPLVRVGILLVSLIAAVAVMNSLVSVHISAIIAVVVTVFSLVWWWTIRSGGTETAAELTMPIYARNVAGSLAGLQGMSVLFAGANIFGQGISRVLDGQVLIDLANAAGINGFAWIPFLLCLIAAMAALGLHPLILIVVLGHTLPLDTIGISRATLALILVTSWGIGGVLSPFSTLTLYCAELMKMTNWRMAWRYNGVYSIGCIIIATLLIGAVHFIG